MKKQICILLFLVLTSTIYAQTNIDTRKIIEVTGSAEMIIQPDEIELEIVLVEYEKKEQKVDLITIENEFNDILRKNKISTNNMTLNYADSYNWWYWWSNRKQPFATKTITLKLTKETNFLKLVEDLNKNWTKSIRIANKKNKDLQKYRKEVKIDAVRAAKEKATYLLESIGEQVGNVISIEEVNENTNNWYRNSSSLSNSVISSNTTNDDDAVKNVATIKLRYEIKAKFQIK